MRASHHLPIGPRLSMLACLLAAGAACSAPAEEAPTEAMETSALATDGDEVAVHVRLTGPSAVEAIVRAGHDVASPTGRAIGQARLLALAEQHQRARSRIEALGGRIESDLSRVTNTLHVRLPQAQLEALAALPEVRDVASVPLHRLALQNAAPVVGAPAAWQSSGLTGVGVTVGIVDSGIDYLHADFGGPGTPEAYAENDRTLIEPGSFPTAHVIGGIDLVGDDYNPGAGNTQALPDDDPLDCRGHGTHVAGIAAGAGVAADGTPYSGPYLQSFAPGSFRVAPGIAPEASLYAIKVFGCNGETLHLLEALDHAVDPDGDGDFSDRLDVINASLGGSHGVGSPATGDALAALEAAGTVVVAAAGNEGSAFFTAGSPAVFPHALAVAASFDRGEWLALTLDDDASVPAVSGAISAPLADTITAPVAVAEPHDACSPIEADLSGHIAVIDRGTCPFLTKLEAAREAGAVAAVVVNNELGDNIFAMGGEGASDIVAVMVRLEDGDAVKAAAMLTLGLDRFAGPGAEPIANFSSRGPSAREAILKPEITAPGQGVDSAGIASGSAAQPNSGTSMACPMVSGAAALVRQSRPAFAPAEVKAALVNTSVPLVESGDQLYPASRQGAGRVDVARAVGQTVTARPANPEVGTALTFGSIVAAEPTNVSRALSVTNHGDAPVSFAVSVVETHALPGVAVSFSPSELTLAAGETANVELELAIDPHQLGEPGPDPGTSPSDSNLPRHWINEVTGYVRLSGEQPLSLPFHAAVRAGASRTVSSANRCGEGVVVRVDGPSAYPAPLTSAFALGALSDPAPEMESGDLRAVGIASDATVVPIDQATVTFGVALEKRWQTPALGQVSELVVGVEIDDTAPVDFAILPVPLNGDQPFADALVAATYRLEGNCHPINAVSCGELISSRPINLMSPNEGNSAPFLNRVIALPTFARDLGLDEATTAFSYQVFTLVGVGVGDSSGWIAHDLDAPGVDTGWNGSLLSSDKLHARVSADAEEPQLLLLHHHNEEPSWEVWSPDDAVEEALAAEVTLPAQVDPVARFTGQVIVENGGTTAATGGRVELDVSGAAIELITSSSGSCDAAGCSLGELAPGQSARIDVMLQAGGPGSVELEGRYLSPSGCEQPLSATTSVTAETPLPPLDVNGGCACTTSPAESSPSRSGGALFVLAALLAGLARRRHV